MDSTLNEAMNVIEIFHSIQGESTLSGFPTTFVRFAKCNLRCVWCDTTYSFGSGVKMTREEIHTHIEQAGLPYVCLTGGEPMLQEELPVLAKELIDRGYTVSVETGGHMDVSSLPKGTRRILDLKTPGAFGKEAAATSDLESLLGQTEFCAKNIDELNQDDEIKIVINDAAELPWVEAAIRVLKLCERAGAVHLSPVHGKVDLETLAAWIVAKRLPVRLHMQLHKLVFGEEATGV